MQTVRQVTLPTHTTGAWQTPKKSFKENNEMTSMIKRLARELTPPIVWSGLRYTKNVFFPQVRKDQILFGGDSDLFVSAAKDIKIYHEYGVGLSTRWIDANTDAEIHSVDTSSDWIATVSTSLTREGHSLAHIDVGPLENWGTPVGFSQRKYFKEYVDGPWQHDGDADLILIDGRFRVSCFLNSLVRGKAGSKIIFDDYTNRPAYHVVEEFLKPVEVFGRQALFVIPNSVDKETVAQARDAFLLVRE